MRMRWVLLLAGLLAGSGAAGAQTVILASTTSVENSGLLGHILPQFEKETGIDVRVLALGTGQALALAARGDADLLLVHDPEAEAAFLAQGHGESRRFVAWNDFVLVGAADDPAHVKGGHDAGAALSAIAAAAATFVSRGDKSGTNALELRLWRADGLQPKAFGPWYRDIGGGMGAALNAAAAMGAYTLSDRGTWLSFGNKGDLAIVVEGGPALLNSYDVIVPIADERRAEAHSAARRLADWLLSAEGQAAIVGYRFDGQPLFHGYAEAMPR